MATSTLRPSCSLTTLTLPLRPRPRPDHHLSSTRPHQPSQTRHASSARRTRKLLNIPPAASFGGAPGPVTGSSGRSRLPPRHALSASPTLLFNPPSSSANVYHTPNIFLPKEDARRRGESAVGAAQGTDGAAATGLTSSSQSSWISLPPSINGREAWVKSYHVQPEQIEEIRRLRMQDENVWTVRKLAQRFECSREFITTIVLASKEKRNRLLQQAESRREEWSEKRLKVWLDRKKRKAMWERDE